MSDWAIDASSLRKAYGGHEALRGLDLRVPCGSIYGFLGRNGAGKTTTIKLLMGLLHRDGGEICLWDHALAPHGAPAPETLSRIGFVTEDKDLYPYMTVEQVVRFTRSFFPKWRADLERRCFELFELPRRRKIPELSKGMRSKLMLLLAIARGAELLILDEPMEGLDPAVAEDVLRELAALTAGEGMTIFFSSHQIADVEQIADHVCIIHQGRALVTGALDDLKAEYSRLHVVLDREGDVPATWAAGIEHVRQEGRVLSILARGDVEAAIAQTRSLPVVSLERFPVSLKELFLEQVRGN
jgi:ABC-2 type transport system ATP-binding protein